MDQNIDNNTSYDAFNLNTFSRRCPWFLTSQNRLFWQLMICWRVFWFCVFVHSLMRMTYKTLNLELNARDKVFSHVINHSCVETKLFQEWYVNPNMMTSSNENISALLALCAENSPVTGEFPSQRPVMRSCDVFFDLRQNKQLSKQSRDWCFETPLHSL